MNLWFADSSFPFPISPESADDSGLVAVGGDLRPGHLLAAYRRGIFPWYNEEDPVCWWSPDPRAIFDLNCFHVSRRLQRTIHCQRFFLTIDRDFSGVIRGCANRPGEGTWIHGAMVGAYEKLHQIGHAHSVEAWYSGVLAGGIYGVAIGGFFAGESMFTVQRDASKVALAFLVERLRQRGFLLFDIQMVTEHTLRLGAKEIPRKDYLARLRQALVARTTFS